MDLKRLSIGQMAKLNNISQQALRLYDKEGLLKPSTIDEETGYRYYHIVQSARLDLIQYMKSSGMTLRQIGELLDSKDSLVIRKFLKKQKTSIDDEIKTLQASQRAVARTLENYKKYETLPPSGEIFMEYIPERKIYHYLCDINFFDQNYTDYEFILRELKLHLEMKAPSMTYFCNVGTIMRKDKVENQEYFSNEIFLFVDEDDLPAVSETLPAATYLCVCANDFYKEKESAKKLIDYIDEHNYTIAGDYLCEVLLEFPIFENFQRNMFLKMQIPVVPKKV